MATKRHNRGGVKGPDNFAQKFAQGNPERLLAFRVQTSLRSPKSTPMTAEELALKFDVTDDQMDTALLILIAESRALRVEEGERVVYKALGK